MAVWFNATYMVIATGLTDLIALTGFAEPHKKQAPGLPGACFNRDQRVWNSSS